MNQGPSDEALARAQQNLAAAGKEFPAGQVSPVVLGLGPTEVSALPESAIPGIKDFILSGGAGRVWLGCCWSDENTECDWDRVISTDRSTMAYLDDVIKAAQVHQVRHNPQASGAGASVPAFARYFMMRGYGEHTLLYCWQEDCRWSVVCTAGDRVEQVVRTAREHLATEHVDDYHPKCPFLRPHSRHRIRIGPGDVGLECHGDPNLAHRKRVGR